MQKYIKSLDGIRGLGILFVIIYHFMRMKGFNWTYLGFSWIWIQMFFIQSGYLISTILLKSKDLPFKEYLKQFFWRRILRIFPLYFGYIFLMIVAYFLISTPDDLMVRLPYLVTYTYNFTRFMPEIEFNSVYFMHFWSLAVEEQFYLIWPFVIYFFNASQLRVLIFAIILGVPVIRWGLGEYLINNGYNPVLTGEIIYAFTFSQFDAFALGAAIPLFSLNQKIKRPGVIATFTILIMVGVGFTNFIDLKAIDASYNWTSLGLAVAEVSNYQHVWSYSIVNIMFTAVILYLIQSDYKGLYNNKLLVSAGKIVYGMYVFHFVILLFVLRVDNKFINNFFISYLLAVLIIYGVAYISYNYYEKPFLKLKNHRFSFGPFKSKHTGLE